MSKATFSLEDVFKKDSPLHDHLRDGMAAFKNVDVKLIAKGERARIHDSLDLDMASRGEYPQANRWDYILSIPDLPEIVGIEPHSAKDDQVSVVIAKKKHAATYLRDHLKDGQRVTSWYWVSHGTVRFSKMDRAQRQLDQSGITFAGRMLRTFG